MIRDLPPELWLEVVSYLPREHVRKLLGINRCLTEMALDDIYYSFTLNNGHQRTVSDIQRITEPRCASRVKRLDIHSCFLAHSPEAADGLITRDISRRTSSSPQPNSAKKNPLRTLGIWLGSLKISSRTPSSSLLSGLVHEPPPVQPKVLTALNVALSRWHQLEEISLFLHDYVSMQTFADFLTDLLSKKGVSIRILSIDVTPRGLFNFLQIVGRRLTPFPNLEHLSIHFTSGEEEYMSHWDRVRICREFAMFIWSHRHSLHTLIIYKPFFFSWVDGRHLIQNLGCLPKLKKVELPVLLEQGPYPIQMLESLVNFLTFNARTLECLILVYRRSSYFSPPLHAYQGLLDNVLPKLCFPSLSELDMEVCFQLTPRPIMPFRLPPLRYFAPKLRKLTLKDSYDFLSDEEFTSLLENLSTGAIQLRSFDFRLKYLGAKHFDQLALNLPTLESLSITYEVILPIMDGPFDWLPAPFFEVFDREYANWALKYLRLAKVSDCGAGHPDSRLSVRVAKSIPGLKINDVSKDCNCVL